MKAYKVFPQSITRSYIGENGKTVHETYYGSQDGRIQILRNKGIGLYLSEKLLDECDDYLCPVIQDGKIGFINSFAEIVISPKYDKFIGEFTSPESVITVFKGEMCGLLNTDGLEILMGEYKSIIPIDNQYAIVMDSEYRKGIIEFMTKSVSIPFGEYDNFEPCESVVIARKKLRKGLITPTGKLITPIRYRWIGSEGTGNLLRVIMEEKDNEAVIKKWGVIDIYGHEVLPVIYDRISPIKGTIVYAVKDGKSVQFNIENLIRKKNID